MGKIMTDSDMIATGLGKFSKEKFNALLDIRGIALGEFCNSLANKGYTQVTTSSLVNIAGSCENPYASFTLNYYGREAHLSQSAQLQLEALVIRLKRGVFTVNNSFREENYDDPEAKGRRLSEFTLIEPERPYEGISPEKALDKIIKEEEEVIKQVTKKVLNKCPKQLKLLGGNINYLKKITKTRFVKIGYDDAIKLLNRTKTKYAFGDDFGVAEERQILNEFNNVPTFVTYFPTELKFFNMKRTADGKRVYSVDLLMPKLGETIGGAIREENGNRIKQQLRNSKIAEFLQKKGQDVLTPFKEYFRLFEQEKPLLRGGYGIGFERYVGFLLNSNDILDTITYRTLHPSQ